MTVKKELISALYNKLVFVSGNANVFAINYLNLYNKAWFIFQSICAEENLRLNLHFLPSLA